MWRMTWNIAQTGNYSKILKNTRKNTRNEILQQYGKDRDTKFG